MAISPIKHIITGDELNKDDIENLLLIASEMKKEASLYSNFLREKHIALIFDKPSLRTRFSFTVAIHQLGGQVVESISQTRKAEEPKDVIRVIQNYCSAVMLRVSEDSMLEEMKKYATIPIVNGLTDLFHPCQALADLLTLKEKFKTLNNLKIAYIGDGNNVLHSLMMMCSKLGIELFYCCPEKHAPNKKVLDMLVDKGKIKACASPKEAVQGCDAVYTDVWTSMGFEPKNESEFAGYQVNEALMSHAKNDAVFMHCMPMDRGKEVSVDLPDAPCSLIFQQSENRMLVQKALLLTLLQ